MIILMILDKEFPPDIRVENEIDTLTNAGFEVHIACYTMQGRRQYEFINNTHIHRKPISSIIYKSSVGSLRFPFYFNFWRKFLSELSLKFKFDAIHVHDLPLAKVGYEIAKNINAGLTLDLHENWPAYLRMATHVKSLLGRFLSNNNQWIKYEKSFCEKADNIIVVVDEAKVRLINIGIDPEKIKVVSNTINLNNIDSLNTIPDNDYFTLFYAGGITKHRGLQFIIPALNKVKLKDKKLRFWVLGTGNYIDNLKQLAREIGVEENIEFFGWKPFNEMMKYLGKSDVCIIPHTKSDHTDTTIPHKLFQYMYFNKPIIASNCDPIERIIEETKCGLVYTHDSENDFADKLKILAENNKVNTTGKKAVADKYNWEKDSETLISIYK